MIKETAVVVCDICGRTELAKTKSWRNETVYDLPGGWHRGANREMTICPECARALNIDKEVSEK